MEKSLVLSAVFPSSRTGPAGLERALGCIAPYGIRTVEYYCEGGSPGDVSGLLRGKRSVFLGGARQKALDLNPCSFEREERELAVGQLAECIRFAHEAGADAFMLSSGRRPSRREDDRACLELLEDSILRIHRAQPELRILLEPGDRDVEFRQLVGPTGMAADLVRSLRGKGVPAGLIFDISHAAQLGEDLETAWAAARPVCGHVHLANCVLDRGSPLYGDRHPFFGVKGGVYRHEDARRFLRLLEGEPEPVTVGLEMICPGGDEEAFFRALADDTRWFFEYAP